tara:strand:- start:754 stop:957 length:204 start_codon:yes stop_codon:yes gene_type:complete
MVCTKLQIMQTQVQFREYYILCAGIFDTTSAINWLQSDVRSTLLSKQNNFIGQLKKFNPEDQMIHIN